MDELVTALSASDQTDQEETLYWEIDGLNFKCPKCGEEYSDPSKFCPDCGVRLVVAAFET